MTDPSEAVRFLMPSGDLVQFPSWPQCRAKTRLGRRCRNEVIDTGQTGVYLDDDPSGYEVDRAADAEKLAAQLCRVHLAAAQSASFREATPYEGLGLLRMPTLTTDVTFTIQEVDAMIAVLTGAVQRLPDVPSVGVIEEMLSGLRQRFISAGTQIRERAGLPLD